MLLPKGHGVVTFTSAPSGTTTWTPSGDRQPLRENGRKEARQTNRGDCVHLVGATVDDVEILKPAGCGGCSQKSTKIWQCAKHDDCAPYALGIVADDTVRDCRACGDYEPKTAAPA